MLPYGDFPASRGSFPVPVPIPAGGPTDGSQVCVQFSAAWLPYVLGALQQLLLQSTWDTTSKTALLNVQQDVFDLIAIFGNSIYGTCLVEPMFQQPDNCNLQVSFDGGGTWTNIYNGLNCGLEAANAAIDTGLANGTLGGATQPTTVTPPAPAQCWTYHVKLSGSDVWLSPVPINDGWQVSVANATGAWYDGSGLPAHWFCPDGNQYVLGACTGFTLTEGTDPLPSEPHMSLLLQYASNFVELPSGSFTFPPGTGAVDMQFRANDSTLGDNSGQIEFDLTVCNYSGTNPGCNVLQNFSLATYGWIACGPAQAGASGEYGGFYQSGLGFVGDNSWPSRFNGWETLVCEITFSAAIHITSVDFLTTFGNAVIREYYGPGGLIVQTSAGGLPNSSSPAHQGYGDNVAGVTKMLVWMNSNSGSTAPVLNGITINC